MKLGQTRVDVSAQHQVSPDWQPVIGEIADGVFVDAGTSGHGFKLAPGLGAAPARGRLRRSGLGARRQEPTSRTVVS